MARKQRFKYVCYLKEQQKCEIKAQPKMHMLHRCVIEQTKRCRV